MLYIPRRFDAPGESIAKMYSSLNARISDAERKTQNFLVQQAEIHDTRIINNVDINETIDIMVSDILEEFGGVENVKQKS